MSMKQKPSIYKNEKMNLKLETINLRNNLVIVAKLMKIYSMNSGNYRRILMKK